MGANDPRGTASLDPRGLIGRVNVGDHLKSIHTSAVSSGPHGFIEEIFSYIALYKHMTPLA